MTFAVATATLILGGVAVAATPPHSYRLKPGSKCRSGYVRTIRVENRQRQIWCVEKPRIATTIQVLSYLSFSDGPGINWSSDVSAEVAYDSKNKTLDGVPLRFGIVNDVTGKTVATFSRISNIFHSCTIVATPASTNTETLSGEDLGTGPACPLRPVTVPADSASLSVTFAGNAKYAPSSGTGSLG
jgi:hypothetical protein